MKKIIMALALASGILGVRAGYAVTNIDGVLDSGAYTILNSGVKKWVVIPMNDTPGNNGADALGFYSLAGSTYAIVITTGGAAQFGGEIEPEYLTSAQILTTVPRRTGAMVTNSTINALCFSTATTIGAWAVVGSTGSVGSKTVGNFVSCQ